MAFKIYTRTGDQGNTSLIGGTKVSKSHLRIESYGTVDELNSYVGLCRDLLEDKANRETLQQIQDRLFTIGSSLASDPAKDPKMSLPDLKEEDVSFLEGEIDRMNEALPEMRNFVIPGGHATVSHLHIARCICRRTERLCVRLEEVTTVSHPLVVKYLNRLSDYLFVLARFTGQQLQAIEIPWRPRS